MNKVPIRTLSDKDAHILARSSEKAIVSKGYVERHGLRWSSHALREWELTQRNLSRKPEVELLIDELDLGIVFVQLPGPAGQTLRAVSTQPQYTENLSLFEHEKLKAALKQKNLECRLGRMDDRKLYVLRLEYYAMLGRQSDPISRRRLEKLRDELARRSEGSRVKAVAADALAVSSELNTNSPDEGSPVAAVAPKPQKSPKKSKPRQSAVDPKATTPAPSPQPTPPNGPGQSLSTPRLGSQSAPNFSSKSVRRTPK